MRIFPITGREIQSTVLPGKERFYYGYGCIIIDHAGGSDREIGSFLNVNVGLVSIFFAVILGYGSGQFTGKEIISGWSGSLFMTLAGITFSIRHRTVK